MTLTGSVRASRLNQCTGFRECWCSSWLQCGNTGASLFGSTLAFHSIEFRAVRIVARDLQ
jgi:hypothetical protein